VDHAVVLRPADADDEPFLRQVFASTRPAEIAALGPAADAFLATQYDLQMHGLRASSVEADVLVIEHAGQRVGRILVGRRPDELRIFDVAVLAEHRRQGIGTAALEALLDAEHRPAKLHAQHDSPAIHLYERLGFVVVAQTDLHLEMERPLS
jgi:ribosomal protein S18 acetylase RimI-like enzyme